MEIKETKKMLKCILTADEFIDHSNTLARTYSEIQELEEQKKSVTSDFKGKIDGSTAEATRIARIIQNGYEFRNVECEVRFIPESKMVETERLDTGEIIENRPMTQEELQSKLFKE